LRSMIVGSTQRPTRVGIALVLMLAVSVGTGCVLEARVQQQAETPAPDLQSQPAAPPQVGVPIAPPATVPQSNGVAVETFHPADPAKARYNVQVMEGVLASAVRYAATQMNKRLQAVSPDLLQLSGAARARGFRLPNYGVFFDVDVPAALRHTMGWTLRLMQQSDQNVQRALSSLRQSLDQLDPKQRAQAENYLKLLETRFQPMPTRPRMVLPPDQNANDQTAPTEAVRATSSGNMTLVNGTTTAPAANDPSAAGAPPAAAPTADDLAWAQNPDLAYEMEVRDALIGAMLEYGSTLSLGPEEYLTIAARDSDNIVLPAGDLSETVTVLLRIKGSDLAEYKAGRLSESDARRRIEIREF
jgi:hypothetical protein